MVSVAFVKLSIASKNYEFVKFRVSCIANFRRTLRPTTVFFSDYRDFWYADHSVDD